MNTKNLSDKSLKIIDTYKNFKIGNAVCSIPYFNNRHSGGRARLKVENGKGSIEEIQDEVNHIIVKRKIDTKEITNAGLKKILVDNNIGIDCSGFAYYILDEEIQSLGKGNLSKNISYPFLKGFFGFLRKKFRPIENIGVDTLAHNENSKVVYMKDITPGDMITMIGNPRNHILIIYKVDYDEGIPKKIYYTHSIAWPSDGLYEHGVSEGIIEIIDLNKKITEQRWIEKEKEGNENYTLSSALTSKTELRRLKNGLF